MTTPAIFGFFPASGAAPAGAGRQAVGNTPTADGPLGLFAALLQLVGGDDSTLPAAQTATALGTPPPIFAVAPETEATEIEEAQPGLLADLADALDALGIGIVADAPLDPVLERQALALVETVAQAAGVPLPVVRVAEAAIAGVASAAAGLIGVATGGAASSTPAETADDPPTAQAALAARLTGLAKAIEPKSAPLAERLAALGAKVATGEINLATLIAAQVPSGEPTEDPEATALRMLAGPPDLKAPAPSAPFAAASLAVPPALGKEGASGKPDGNVTSPTEPADPADAVDSPPIPREARHSADRAELTRPGPAPASSTSPNPPPNTLPDPTSNAAQPQIGSGSTPSPAPSADARAAQAAYAAPVRQINIPQVAFEIARQVQAGATRFEIRIDPPELGRIDVKLDIDAAGNLNARMAVERAETLDLLQRDHRALERALAQAGIDSSKTNLEFSLRQNPFSQHEQQQQRPGHHHWAATAPEGGDAAASAVAELVVYRSAAPAGGLNLIV